MSFLCKVLGHDTKLVKEKNITKIYCIRCKRELFTAAGEE